jgi:thiol:disulfide interchange protein DsbD
LQFRISAALAIAVLFATTTHAQLGLSAPDPASGPKVTLEGSIQKKDGSQVEGLVVAHVADGWHINSAKPLDEFAIPTVLTLQGATLGQATYPQHKLMSFSFSAGREIAVYEGAVQIPFTATLQGEGPLTASLRYQACNDSVCLPPRDASVQIDTTKVTLAPTPSAGGFTPLSEAPKGAAAAPSGDRLATTFASKGLPLTLLALFVLGMALNLTPCVFPLIPITLGFFAMQSDGRRSRRFALSAMYVLGIVIMYSALGVLASLGGKMFGAWLQLPAVQVGFAVLMLILATSMFGAFEIQAPRFIANRSQGRAGGLGALSMGLIVGIVAAPCVGPVVISLITLVAQLADPWLGFAMFASLAFGLGFPYLVMLNALPKPGEWMVQVKKAMGFVLIAMAIYFLRPMIGEKWFALGVAACLLIGAGFLFLQRGTQGRTMRLAMATLLLIGGVFFAWPNPHAEVASSWKKYDEKTLAAAKAEGKPIIIDFYADWCIPCKELDAKTFSDPKVAKELDRFTRIKADLTRAEDAKTKALTKEYAILGVPTIVIIDSKGQELKASRLTGFEGAEPFLERIRSVR